VDDPPHNGNRRFRVVNGGFWSVNEATLYLTLDIQEQDTVPAEGLKVHIAPGRFVPLSGEPLCWSSQPRTTPNPMKITILAKECQPFSPCQIRPDGILIPSEEGWPPAATARVLLRRRRYTGVLKIVSADTNARFFQIRIDPETTPLCVITPLKKPHPTFTV